MKQFDIPVVLIIFKRLKVVEIIQRIREVAPKKLYILADNGRNDEEKKQVAECRRKVEECIDWDCEVVKNYAEENRGVYGNIALGAKWIFEREKVAIFLEDDNLPEPTFFAFCKDMLERYCENDRILWVCGTNYLGEYQSPKGDSYMFTRHMLPCGWASWSHKFLKYYDETLSRYDDPIAQKKARKNCYNRYLYNQYKRSWRYERNRILTGLRPISWDYQMDFCVKANDLLGISPRVNQIKNIGVDSDSIHGGSKATSEMNIRLCGMPSFPLSFPLKHPKEISVDPLYERKIAKIVAFPLKVRYRNLLVKIRRLFK